MRRISPLFAAFALVAVVSTVRVTPSSAASRPHCIVSHLSVTATSVQGESTVSLDFTNDTHHSIWLTSISSRDAGMGMFYSDKNVFQGNSQLTWLANILVSKGSTAHLGYKLRGAMLIQPHEEFVKGETIPLVVTWSDFSRLHHVPVNATVVMPPHTLHFSLPPMVM